MGKDIKIAYRRFDEALVDLLEMSAIMRDDLNALLDADQDANSSQPLRRNVVRASWAYIEAVPSAMKAMLLALVEAGAYSATDKEHDFLIASRCETRSNLRDTLRLSAKVFAVPQRDLGAGGGWPHVRPMIALRNRLVHPKSAAALHVTDNEWCIHIEGFNWLINSFDGILMDIHAKCVDPEKA